MAVEGSGFDGGGGGSGGVAGGSGGVEAGGEVHWWVGWVGEEMGEEGGIEWIGDFENVLFDEGDCEQAHWKGELLLELEVMGLGKVEAWHCVNGRIAALFRLIEKVNLDWHLISGKITRNTGESRLSWGHSGGPLRRRFLAPTPLKRRLKTWLAT